MSQVSKHKLNQKVYDKIFTLFPQFLNRLSVHGKAGLIIGTLFSKTEQTIIAKRIAIAFMLVKGYGYEQIMDKLKVSSGTVGKIAEMVKTTDKKLIRELESIAKEQAFGEFLDIIGYKLAVMLPPKGGNWSVWRRRIEEDKRKSEQPF